MLTPVGPTTAEVLLKPVEVVEGIEILLCDELVRLATCELLIELVPVVEMTAVEDELL